MKQTLKYAFVALLLGFNIPVHAMDKQENEKPRKSNTYYDRENRFKICSVKLPEIAIRGVIDDPDATAKRANYCIAFDHKDRVVVGNSDEIFTLKKGKNKQGELEWKWKRQIPLIEDFTTITSLLTGELYLASVGCTYEVKRKKFHDFVPGMLPVMSATGSYVVGCNLGMEKSVVIVKGGGRKNKIYFPEEMQIKSSDCLPPVCSADGQFVAMCAKKNEVLWQLVLWQLKWSDDEAVVVRGFYSVGDQFPYCRRCWFLPHSSELLLSLDKDNTFHLWRTADLLNSGAEIKPLKVFKNKDGVGSVVAMSPAGNVCAFCGAHNGVAYEVMLLNTTMQNQIDFTWRESVFCLGKPVQMAFNRKGSLLAVLDATLTLHVYDVPTGCFVKKVPSKQ